MKAARIAILLALSTMSVSAAQIEGAARVIDGDTLAIGAERIRLHGIDAPESEQACRNRHGRHYMCSMAATEALRRLVEAQQLSCAPREIDVYGRTIAICRVGTIDISAEMVKQGHALAFRRYSLDYVAQEDDARTAARGMWAGTFETPWDWRAKKWETAKREPQESVASSSDCAIKGNINRKGERIYHIPGGADYGRTRIATGKGERWFCSEDEARNAGWRAAGGPRR